MARPNSLLTRVRSRLTRWLEPVPGDHEAWCVGCSMNGRRTMVIGPAAVWDHVRAHREAGHKETLQIKVKERTGVL